MKRLLALIISIVITTSITPSFAKSDSAKIARKAEKEQQRAERRAEAEREYLAEPHFKGGDIEKFEKWVQANLKFDYGSLPRDTPHIRVDVPFWVEADGSTSLMEGDTPSKRLHPQLVEAIERVIPFSPEWEPAHDQMGNPIRSSQTLSLTINNHSYIAPITARPVGPRPMPRRR